MTVYLDNNATTMPAPEVREAMLPFLGDMYSNASSFHSFGTAVREAVEQARSRVAALIRARPEEVYFTSGGTESDNWAIKGAMARHGSGALLVTSAVEHPAVLEIASASGSLGFESVLVPVDSGGNADIEAYRRALEREPALVSMMMANNETGVIFPVGELADLAHQAGALFHTDAVQAVGKVPVDLEARTGIDLLSISGHKLHAPKGIGALFVRRGVDLEPFMHGGHQERGLRSGTYNSPGIVGLGMAAELAASLPEEAHSRLLELRTRMEIGILERCPGSAIVARESDRLPNTLTAIFSGVESESTLMMLDMEGVCASSGSACSTGSKDPSHVLKAMGIGSNLSNSAIRFSLSRYTTADEVDLALDVLERAIAKLRRISPYV
ncbi:aminotransferase class V-fold PLP-dependent enzyme [Candidatus Fermentibacterales bacterium]|nr:aminotransferase class V-fold PLP-dependent enzyme [Candidatus Fermentibacterales bacterium]